MRKTADELVYAVKAGGGEAVPEQRLKLCEIADGTEPELVFALPPMPMHGLLTLAYGDARAEVPVISV